MNYLEKLSKDWVITVVLFIVLATVSFTSIKAAQINADIKKVVDSNQQVSEENQRFLINFSSFMNCLVVNDETVVIALGEEAYFAECNKLLFRGTGLKPEPVTRPTLPPEKLGEPTEQFLIEE